MGVVATVLVSVILGVTTVLFAGSHGRPFDAVSSRSERRWWSQIP